MKRSTKKLVFISAMLLTIGSLFATVGMHHHGFYQHENRCGYEHFKHTCKNEALQNANKVDEGKKVK